MGIQFNEPWYLLLLLPLAAFAIWAWRTYPARGGWRRRMAVPLRSLILLLLILALAGLQTVASMEQKAVYFVLDRSDSMPAGQTAGQWIQASVSAKGEKDLAGVISTGLESLVERHLSGEGPGRIAYDGKVNTQFTHLAGGLQLAGSLFPESVTPRIVLISDGEENAGDLLRQARLLQNKGIPVDVLPMAKEAGRDISIESVKVPEKIYQAEKYSLEISLNSTFAGTGELRVYEDNQELTREQVTVEKGENRFAFQSLAREPGFHRYRAEIYFPDDEQAANNSGYAFSRVTGPPKVLIVEGKPGSSSNITAALTSGLIGFTIISPEMLPSELADYTGYDSIILNNVPATRISGPKMERIEQAVRDYGIGLLMVGGEDSYGLGGYFKTPIEKALPVKMELEGKREVPSLGLILVVDRSGSMGGGKLELAKEAALRTVEMLRDKDTVGVVAFDTSPWWVVEPTRLTDREKVMEQISSIQPDGGTEIYTAVDAAYQKLLKVEAQRKHIILLTDGQSATSQSYEALTGNMVQNNMTMSTVAVGDGADGQLLEYLSKLAKGRYYFTNDQSTLPAIFSRETVMMSRTYVVDQPFVPAAGQLADWSGLFGDGVPKVKAYVAATAKESAETILLSPEPDPLLVRWQYGSGRSVAWTSDFSGKWSPDWTSWDRFPEVFSRLVKWTFPQFQASAFEVTSRLEGDEVKLDLKSADPAFQGEIQATVTDEALGTTELAAIPTLPGEYEAQVPVRQPGVYLTRIDVQDPADRSKTLGSSTTGFVIPYSPEYRLSAGDQTAKLKQLADMTGGRLLSSEHPEEVFQGAVQAKKQSRDRTRLLLAAAALLWVADIAARRLNVPWSRLAERARRRFGFRGRPVPVPSAPAKMERLGRRKDQAAAFYRSLGEERPPDQAPGAGLMKRGEDALAEENRKAQAGKGPSRAPVRDRPGGGEGKERPVPPPDQPVQGETAGRSETMSRLLAAKKRRQ